MVQTFETKTDYSVVGTRPIRHDGLEKVTGRAIYGGDVTVPGLIWGEVLRSPHVHARIKTIDVSAAENIPGVFAVVTHEDFPKKTDDNGVPRVDSDYGVQNLMAGDKVLYKGHVVAAVAAVDRNTAKEAADLIKVEYELLPPVRNVDEAMADDAPILLNDLVGDHLGDSAKETNIAQHFRYEFGDLDKGFGESDSIVERTFTLQMVHQGYIEPHNATAIWGQDGKVILWSSTQGAFGVREQTAAFLNIPESNVKVNPVEIGGGFGGKTKVYLAPVAALLSRKSSGRPVKMIMDRSSIFEATGPAPGGKIRVKLGATKDGKIRAADVDLRYEAGAFPGSAVSAGSLCVLACYNIANTRIDAYDVVVNKPKSAAYRAPGSPQAAFAIEQVVDEICDQNGWDKIAFRLDNASKEGTRRGDGVRFDRIGFEECLIAARDSDHWQTPLEPSTNGMLRGRGIGCGYWMNGGGKSSVDLMLQADGRVMMNEGSADIGGTRASIAMQAAEVLGVSAEDVHPSIPDTDSIGYTGVTGGSRTTYATGYAAWLAANQLIEELKCRAGTLWGIGSDDVVFKDGKFSSGTDPELTLSIKDLADKLDDTGGPVAATASVNMASAGNGYAVHICDLEIDPHTGKTDVLRYTAVQDVGKAVHPSYAEGQIQGGVAQGIGWALNEEYFIQEDGSMANHTFLDYRMPTSLDMPMIDTIMVEVPNPMHPFGVRGVGEVPLAPPLPAVANAIKGAIGERLVDHPLKPGRILEALGN